MGLDSVEILVKVENTFGINIPDQEAEKIRTVGDFHNCVWKHLQGKYSDRCESQSLFYKLRQSVADTFNFPKQAFRSETALDKIFPHNNRRKVYLSFAHANNLELPDLVLTKPWSIFLSSFGMATIVGGLILAVVLINFFEYSNWMLLIPAGGIAMTILLSNILEPFRTNIKPGNVKEFVKEVLSMNYAKLIKENGVNRTEVEIVINHILADMSGLELKEITPEKNIHNDLGID
jgi:acyl carrier protein